MNFKILIDTLATVGDVAGFFGAVFAILAWLKLKALDRQNQPIRVLLKLASGENQIELPLYLRRGDLSRAEMLGRIGMIPMREKGNRFSLRYLSTPEFIQGINRIADGKSDVLEIPCSQDEIEQFDLS